MTRSLPRIAFVLVLLASSLAVAQKKRGNVEQRRLDLFIGEQKVISAKNVDKYSEGTPGVIDIRLPEDASDFVIVGKSAGSTTLLLILDGGKQIRYNIVVREVRVTERDNVRLDFYFVEVNRDSSTRLGVGWPGTIGGTAYLSATGDLQGGAVTSTASIAAEVLPRIDLAQSNGWAKILREASMTMANGEKATFESGGELNFRVESAVATSIQQIRFGSRIEVQPRFDRTTGRLDVNINAVVSELTDLTTDGLPGRSITSLNTAVNMGLGEAIVLAGIHSKTYGRSKDGLPVLSQIPVFGIFFGINTWRDQETENLMFIVPTVLQPTASEKRTLVARAFKAYATYEGDADGTKIFREGFKADPSAELPEGQLDPEADTKGRRRRRR